jgi:demethylmenaquinone methyltransferase/2-methoxy-6-polyprenyl-1,4-benzoquinol methylase
VNDRDYDIVAGFDAIAPRYDRANDAISFGLHRRWRRRLCGLAAAMSPPNGKVLDVATGTGAVILGMIGARPDLAFIGIDPSESMLAVARRKLHGLPAEAAARAAVRAGDARRLAFRTGVFDTVTCAWGVRNIRPFTDGLSEMLRVLKPGGALAALESGRPEAPWLRAVHGLFSRVLPGIGGAVAGFRPAYDYYVRSADAFPCGRDFVAALRTAGFAQASSESLCGGIVFLYRARKPMPGGDPELAMIPAWRAS